LKSAHENTAQARLVVDPAKMIPFVMRCPIRPGQFIYMLESEVLPSP